MPQVAAPIARVRVFVDTNVILEAFRIGCWSALTSTFSVETVEKCVEEALTGDPADPRHVAVDRDVLVEGLAARHAVDKRTLARFALAHPASAGHTYPCGLAIPGMQRHLRAILDAVVLATLIDDSFDCIDPVTP